jgi:hypothetical protein
MSVRAGVIAVFTIALFSTQPIPAQQTGEKPCHSGVYLQEV